MFDSYRLCSSNRYFIVKKSQLMNENIVYNLHTGCYVCCEPLGDLLMCMFFGDINGH